MFALAYDAALRREELCSLQTGDIDPARRLLHIRAETTKNRQARVVPYSEATGVLYASYLQQRQMLSRERGVLFLSESHRNRAQPVSIWTWSKVVEGIAKRSNVQQLTTHTTRHLCLTDLARMGGNFMKSPVLPVIAVSNQPFYIFISVESIWEKK